MSLEIIKVLKSIRNWITGKSGKSQTQIQTSNQLTLEVQSLPNYSIDGMPGFAVVPVCEMGLSQTKLSPISSADFLVKGKGNGESLSEADLGHGHFSVKDRKLEIHISQSDMDFGLPMGSHLLGTIDENGHLVLSEDITAAIKIKYDSRKKISKIDLTFVLSEEKITMSENEIQP